ncbi:hypothetical protein AD929_15765 [Gluconobacter potus]|uniref:Uncharacterized protein n=1 Tax=Gluconobacter potus TaxID=2724927 RepID=A0A149QPP1_9PROT|nr:hypothetical protein [Gluconobacter potus]KXU99250.1 hypothetical protein AD929_15765 [Gluconobacter potus]
MTLPWYLNPWAEVRRLEREAYEQHKWAIRERNSYRAMEDLADRAITALENQEAENADLRRQIAKMEKGSRRAGAQTDEEILSRFVGAHAEKSYPRFKHSRSVTPGRRFKI